MVIHQSNRHKFQCTQCVKSYARKATLAIHYKKKHPTLSTVEIKPTAEVYAIEDDGLDSYMAEAAAKENHQTPTTSAVEIKPTAEVYAIEDDGLDSYMVESAAKKISTMGYNGTATNSAATVFKNPLHNNNNNNNNYDIKNKIENFMEKWLPN
jgi:hypothetical protein